MSRRRKMKVVRGCQLTLALLAAAALGLGQNNNSAQAPAAPVEGRSGSVYPSQRSSGPATISPGTVNYVEGRVTLDGRALAAGSTVQLQPGRTLATSDGFVEVLLTPGSFVRVGHNSQIRLLSAGLADTRAQLDHGTAMIEVDQLIKGTNVGVVLNGANVQLEKKGLYDFDADVKAVRVLDGKANVIEASGSKKIGKGDQLLLASEQPLKSTGFNSKAIKTNPLYVWSEARSRDESQANVALAQNVAAYGGWYGPGWYWDPYWSFYAYLPGNGLLYSPFGWGFYSPAFIGYYGVPFRYYGGYGHYGARHGYVGGMNAHVNGFRGGGFHGGGRR
jgi:hypothetical protein